MFSVPRIAGAVAALVVASLSIPRTCFANPSVTDGFCAVLLADVEGDLRDIVEATQFEPQNIVAHQSLFLLATAVVRLAPPARLGAPMAARGRYREAVYAFRAVGGQIQRTRGDASSFTVRPDGAPVLRLARDRHFAHEWDHFVLWREVRHGFQLLGFDAGDAGVLAFALMLTPRGVMHAEARASLVDLKKLSAERPPKDTDLATLLQRQSHPYLAGLRATAMLLAEAKRFRVEGAESLLWGEWDRLLDNFVEGFDAFQDRVRDHFVSRVRRRSIGEWDRRLRDWMIGRSAMSRARYEDLPDDLRAYAIYRRATWTQRRDRLLEMTAESEFLRQVVGAVEAHRRRRR